MKKAEVAILETLANGEKKVTGFVDILEQKVEMTYAEAVAKISEIEHAAAARGLRVVHAIVPAVVPEFIYGIYAGIHLKTGDKLEVTLSDGSKTE